MDSLSQLLLGAAVGYAVGSKKLGKKSLLLGAAAGTLPDLDVIPLSLFNDDFIMLKHHRGFSHSILFCLIASPILAKLTQLKFKTVELKCLNWLYFWTFFTHSLLDCFTTWGTQLFWPFSYRVAFNSIFIIDPFYTIWLLLAVIYCCIKNVSKTSIRIMYSGLIISSLYLCIGLGIKWKINYEFTQYFNYHNIKPLKFMTRPSPFNIILWSATAETPTGYYMAFRSLFDNDYTEKPKFSSKSNILVTDYNDSKTNYIKFVTKHFFIMSAHKEGILIHDLRFGSFNLLSEEFPAYIFSYKLSKDDSGNTQMSNQNPNFKRSSHVFSLLYKRIFNL